MTADPNPQPEAGRPGPTAKAATFWNWAGAKRRWAILLLPVMLILGAAFGSASATLAAQTAILSSDEQIAEGPEPTATRNVPLDAANARIAELEELLEEVATELEGLVGLDEELAAREAAVAEREAAVSAVESAREANTFGDGVYLVGVDIVPGTYRNDGGSSCYWERLSGVSGTFGDIIANDNVDGPAVVAIAATDVAFSSSRCGTWNLVG